MEKKLKTWQEAHAAYTKENNSVKEFRLFLCLRELALAIWQSPGSDLKKVKKTLDEAKVRHATVVSPKVPVASTGAPVSNADVPVLFETGSEKSFAGFSIGDKAQICSEFGPATRAGQVGIITKAPADGEIELFLPEVGANGVSASVPLTELQSFSQLQIELTN